MNEAEMREATVPTLDTPEELAAYITSLLEQQHDYGTCVYALSMAATATFNYTARKLGVTGFQASCADFDLIRRTRQIDGPFMLIKGQDALFPQYDLQERLRDALEEWKPWLKEQAAKKLEDTTRAAPRVVEHWQKLAS